MGLVCLPRCTVSAGGMITDTHLRVSGSLNTFAVPTVNGGQTYKSSSPPLALPHLTLRGPLGDWLGRVVSSPVHPTCPDTARISVLVQDLPYCVE